MPQETERDLALVHESGLLAQIGQPVFQILPRGSGRKLQLRRPVREARGDDHAPPVIARTVLSLLEQDRQRLLPRGAQPPGRRVVPSELCGKGA